MGSPRFSLQFPGNDISCNHRSFLTCQKSQLLRLSVLPPTCPHTLHLSPGCHWILLPLAFADPRRDQEGPHGTGAS